MPSRRMAPRGLWLGLRALLSPRGVVRELHDELDFPVEMQAHKHARAGLPSAEARRLARAEFGSVGLVKEDARDVRGLRALEQLSQDVRYAFRGFLLAPTFALTVLLTIALALGLNTTVFTIFNAYVLRPLEVRDPYALYEASWADRVSPYHSFSWYQY